VEGYGGDVPIILTSAKTGAGVKELLDMIILMADLEHFVGHLERWGTGVIIESKLDPKRGITTVGIIKDGTVKKGMTAASVGAIAPLRFILDAEGNEQESLSFSSPIQIVGWDSMPPVGATFELFENKKAAEFYAESEAGKSARGKKNQKIDENMFTLPIIIKADVSGSLEAIVYEINKLSRERIVPQIVIEGVGTVGENDIHSAMTMPGTIIFAFHTKIDPQARALAERSGVIIESFDIIYKLTERISELLNERKPRIEVEEISGTAKVLKIFNATKDKQVLGARVTSGLIKVGGQVRIVRRETEIGKGVIKELQQNKIGIDKISEGDEFGAMIESKIEIAPGDVLEEIIKVTK
jgi:translation initiation factor IF-2